MGIAGARGLDVPQVVIGSEAVYEDAAGGALVPGRVYADAELLDCARRALPEARVLPIGTSARVGGTTGCAVEAELNPMSITATARTPMLASP